MVDASIGFRVLGTQFALVGRCSAEVRAGVAAAWGKLRALWPALGKKSDYYLKKLFDATVSQSALWCCEGEEVRQNNAASNALSHCQAEPHTRGRLDCFRSAVDALRA